MSDKGSSRTAEGMALVRAILLLIFTPLALGSWVALPFSLLTILIIAVRAREEEKFLSANLSGYEAYRQKVRYRLIPFIW